MPSIRIGVHTSITAVRETWDRIAPRGEVVLESAHLEAIARSGVNDIEPYYLIAYDGERPAGIAYCFLMRLDLASLEKDISPEALVALRSWERSAKASASARVTPHLSAMRSAPSNCEVNS